MNENNSKDLNEYKYILIDNSDPNLMWNCALSIVVFIILFFYVYMNWKPLCSNKFENMTNSINTSSVMEI